MKKAILQITSILLTCSCLLGEETLGILDSFKKADAMLEGQNPNNRNIGYSVSYTVKSLESSDAVHGAQINICEVVWTNGFAMMSATSSYERDPIFRIAPRSGLRTDFNDEESNLVVRRQLL